MDVAADDKRRSISSKTNEPPSDGLRVTYKPHPETTPSSEVQTLANVYAFILERHHQRQVAVMGDEDETGPERDHARQPPEEQQTGEGSA